MAEDDYNFDDFLNDDVTETKDSSKVTKEEASGKKKKSTSKKKEKVSEDYDEGFLVREREKFKPEPITFHMNPIDAEIIRATVDKTKKKTQGDLMSYFVDKFVQEKGIDKVIKVLNEYRNKDEDGLF